MIKITEIIKKNFRLLLRSRTSALIVLIGPLILMLLIGFAFNTTSLFDIKIGTYSSGYSELSDSIITKLQDDQFRVTKVDSEDDCINMVKSGDVHVCTVFPANLNIKTSDKITFYVDKSRLNFVYIILDRISSKIATKSTELSTALTNRLLTSLNNANTKLDSSKVISSDLESSQGKVSEVSSNLAGLDTSTTSANFSKLKTEIDASNLSSSVEENLKDLVKSVEASYDDMSSKILAIGAIKDSSTKSLNEVKETLSGNIEDAKAIEKSVKEIKDDINSIEVKDVSRIVSPISTEIQPIVAESSNLSFTFPTLVLLVILFAGLFIGSTSVMEEKTSKAYFRNFITPTKDILFVIGQYISDVIIILLQLLVILSVMLFITKTTMHYTLLLSILLIMFLAGSVFILIGMIIGYLFKTGETANMAAISVGALLLFFSNTVLPIETLPTTLRGIIKFSPFILGENSLKKIILFNESLMSVMDTIYILAGFSVVLFLLAYLTREATKRQVS